PSMDFFMWSTWREFKNSILNPDPTYFLGLLLITALSFVGQTAVGQERDLKIVFFAAIPENNIEWVGPLFL
ncbi:MAG: hypothetical protein ABL958_19370, partial [Bdellovibrionia bacterium]